MHTIQSFVSAAAYRWRHVALLALLCAPAIGEAQANPNQIAILRWYEANEAGVQFNLNAGYNAMAGGIAFDGECMWVASRYGVTKLKADGTAVGTYPVGTLSNWSQERLVFDGGYIWVANGSSNTVTKVKTSDGSVVGRYAAGATSADFLAFDGANIWVGTASGYTVTKLKASDGTFVGTYTLPEAPRGIAFDGANIWVTGGYKAMKLKASDGIVVGVYSLPAGSTGLAFDGANIWTVGYTNTWGPPPSPPGYTGYLVTKVKASDGSIVGMYPVSSNGTPYDVLFDGANIWVSTAPITKLRASDGSVVGTYGPAIGISRGLAFDGANIWAANGDVAAKF